MQLNPFHMFTQKVVILTLPKKWHKMIWDKQPRWSLFYTTPDRSYNWWIRNMTYVSYKNKAHILMSVASSTPFEANKTSNKSGLCRGVHWVMDIVQSTQHNLPIFEKGDQKKNECLGRIREFLPQIFPWGWLVCSLSKILLK